MFKINNMFPNDIKNKILKLEECNELLKKNMNKFLEPSFNNLFKILQLS